MNGPLAIAAAILIPWQLSSPVSKTGPDGRLLFAFRGEVAADRFGTSVASAGDVDGDGIGDVIVGAPHAAKNGPLSGAVRVFSGRSGGELLTLTGESPSDRFGFSVQGGHDVDGDGRDDLAIGSPTGTPPAGSVHLHSGASGRRLWTRAGNEPGDRYGHAVGLLPDIDGDGRAEVAVGAPHDDRGGTNAGRVEVLSGRDGAVLWAYDGSPWDQLGFSVRGVKDLSGDGHGELLVGAPFADVGAFNSGSAFLLSGVDGAVLRAFHGTGIGDQLGNSVSAAGDVDGDGTPDLLLGLPGADVAGTDSGAAQVRSGATGDLLFIVPGESSENRLEAVASLGDVNGDGRDDFAVGAAAANGVGPQSGRIRIVSGADGTDLLRHNGRTSFHWFGAELVGLGDLGGDGRFELLVGAPGHDDHLEKRGYALLLSIQARE